MTPSDLTVDTLKQLLDERDKRYAQEILALKHLMDERDARTEERFSRERAEQETANVTALAAQKELVAAAFAASEKAIVKQEMASNQAIIKQETASNQRFDDLDRKLGDLSEVQSRTGGERRGGRDMWVLVTGGILFLLGIAAYFGVGK